VGCVEEDLYQNISGQSPRQTGFPPYKTERTTIYATTTLKANHSFSTSSRATNAMILWFVREFACVGRSLRTRLVKPSIATIFGALLVFVTFPNAWGQSASTGSTPIVKMRTLQIDALGEARHRPIRAGRRRCAARCLDYRE